MTASPAASRPKRDRSTQTERHATSRRIRLIVGSTPMEIVGGDRGWRERIHTACYSTTSVRGRILS